MMKYDEQDVILENDSNDQNNSAQTPNELFYNNNGNNSSSKGSAYVQYDTQPEEKVYLFKNPVVLDPSYRPNGTECNGIEMHVYKSGRRIQYPYQVNFYSQHACEIAMTATSQLEGKVKVDALYNGKLIQTFEFTVSTVKRFKNAIIILLFFFIFVLLGILANIYYLGKGFQLTALIKALDIQKQKYWPKDKKLLEIYKQKKKVSILETQNRKDPFQKYDSRGKIQSNVKIKVHRNDILFSLNQLEANKNVQGYQIYDKTTLIKRKYLYKFIDMLEPDAVIAINVQKNNKIKGNSDDRIFTYDDLTQLPSDYKVKVKDPLRKNLVMSKSEVKKCLEHLKLEQHLQAELIDYYQDMHQNIKESIQQNADRNGQNQAANDIFATVTQKLQQDGYLLSNNHDNDSQSRGDEKIIMTKILPNVMVPEMPLTQSMVDSKVDGNGGTSFSGTTTQSTDVVKKSIESQKENQTALFGLGTVDQMNSSQKQSHGSSLSFQSPHLTQDLQMAPGNPDYYFPSISLNQNNLLRPQADLGLIHTIHETSTFQDTRIHEGLDEPGAMELDLLLHEDETTNNTTQANTNQLPWWQNQKPPQMPNIPSPGLFHGAAHSNINQSDYHSQISEISLIGRGLNQQGSMASITTSGALSSVIGMENENILTTQNNLEIIQEERSAGKDFYMPTRIDRAESEDFRTLGDVTQTKTNNNTGSQEFNQYVTNDSTTSQKFSQNVDFNLYNQFQQLTKFRDSKDNISKESTMKTQNTSIVSFQKKDSIDNLGNIDFMQEFHEKAKQTLPMSSAINSRRSSIINFNNDVQIEDIQPSTNPLSNIHSTVMKDIVSGVDMEVATRQESIEETEEVGPQVVRAFGDEMFEPKKKKRVIAFANKLAVNGKDNEDSDFSFEEDPNKYRNIERAKAKLLANYNKLQKTTIISNPLQFKYALNMFQQKGCYFQRLQLSIVIVNTLLQQQPGTMFFNCDFVVIMKRPSHKNVLLEPEIVCSENYVELGAKLEFATIVTKNANIEARMPDYIRYKHKRLQVILMVMMMSEIVFGRQFTYNTLITFLENNATDEIHKPYCILMSHILIYQQPNQALQILKTFLPQQEDAVNNEQDRDYFR